MSEKMKKLTVTKATLYLNLFDISKPLTTQTASIKETTYLKNRLPPPPQHDQSVHSLYKVLLLSLVHLRSFR